jgi:hypothetical protein
MKALWQLKIIKINMHHHQTAESSGGTGVHGHTSTFHSGKVENKLACTLDDLVFGQSLGEGKSSKT